MRIAKGRWVRIEYLLLDENGAQIDRVAGDDPLDYVHGDETLIPGLQHALLGHRPGDHVRVTIPPSLAYGRHVPELVHTLRRENLDPRIELQIGAQLPANTEEGRVMVRIIAIDESEITLDANHPLAGRVLHFHVDVVQVRESQP